MSDQTIGSRVAFVRREAGATRPAPIMTRGVFAWIRENLFSTPMSGVLTIGSVLFVAWIVPDTFRYLISDAIWSAPDGAACRAPGAGACWAYVAAKFEFFMYGSYPRSETWRVDFTLVLGFVLILWLMTPRFGRKGLAALSFFVIYPVLAFFLLRGLSGVLPLVESNLWGGVFVSLLVAAVGIVISLPLGVLLALGRRSELPFVKFFCVVFIEFVRGVPLVTVLFMASVMLPLFVPEQYSPDKLLRALVGIAMFASAYMAEVVRAGLQAIPKGQFEGAMAVGLGYWQMMRLIVLPQALKITIPNIVNTYIGLFKDTTLVFIVGIFDLLHTIEVSRIDPKWATPVTSTTGYAVAGIFYLVFCYAMSRYARATEARLAKSERR